ncbi:MAG: hypothetical protein NNA18_11725 [Nitrospira sp.]|nr:hypothetical protein [Nitrospira sp.]
MNSPRLSLAILIGAAFIAAGADVHAQLGRPELNIAGASAAKPFVEEVPIVLCDNPTGEGEPTFVSGAPIPEVFMNGPLGPTTNPLANSKFITWRCNATRVVGLPQIIIRYQSTGSGDGIKKVNERPTLPDGSPNPAARQVYVVENPAACGAPVVIADARGRSRRFYPSCTQFSPNPNTDPGGAYLVNLGVSDVAPSSYGQLSFANEREFVDFPIQPDNNIELLAPVVTTYAIVLGSAVKRVDNQGRVLGPVTNLTRLQVEALFSRNVTRWNQFNNIAADTNGNGIIDPDDNQTVIICSRRATSGTKAAFQATLMKEAKEHTGQLPLGSLSFNLTLGTPSSPSAGPTNLAGISNNDVRDCIQGNPNPTIPSNDPFPYPGPRPAHPTAVAYMEAEQASTIRPDAGYVVAVDGGKARRTEPIYAGNEKENVRCGKFEYWTYQRITRRLNPRAVGVEDQLITAYFRAASRSDIINNLPNVGQYWVAPSEMRVVKGSDRGPVQWRSNPGSAPPCLDVVNNIP